ncbi:thiazole/oxazole-forming peptide maturase, SagD family component [Desulfitobacterium chlororespirans DSM 11544]|uniref:Thiazole/oxazole-forming peptide maturase, SagD family component n=1 Tax=Desulfitobacterium chlororespirans DSM 11544 TaxID=1121395 RepID=A0A1M7UKQ3_9FIRM|nr:thiazole/oxazole-forming peptide maturase, SagD family component [Desulfitobacterium chlororespirans DSM 11544]
MTYNPQSVPRITPSFSRVSLGKGRVATTVNGEFKLIQCSPSALDAVLALIDGQNTFEQIEQNLQSKYPLDGIRTYLSILLQEQVIEEAADSPPGNPHPSTVLVVGEGRMAQILKEQAPRRNMKLLSFPAENASSLPDILDFAADLAVIAPSAAHYGQIFELNSAFIQRNIPFVSCYYNGSAVVVGPFVIPGKTSCLECAATYHLEELNRKLRPSQRLPIAEISDLQMAYPIPDAFKDSLLEYLGDMILEEIGQFLNGSPSLHLLDSEKHFFSGHCTPQEIKTAPTTACQCCHGLSRTYIRQGETSLPGFTEVFSPGHRPIRYTTGGFRSCSPEDTQNFIREALRKTGLDIKITRVENNPFDRFLPVFRGSVKANHHNQTPYYFKDLVVHGKGLHETQAFLSASYEMAERLSASFYGDLPIVEAPYRDIKERAIDLKAYVERIVNQDTSYETFRDDLPIDWVCAKSLVSGDSKFVPAHMVFLGDNRFKGQLFSNGSSGLAAGATLEDAILQGLFEVIEHDAWMIGQANRFTLPLVDHASSGNQQLKDLIHGIHSLGYRVITRDYTNDLGFPVFRTWIVNPNSYTHYGLSGFGASLSAEIALERSVTEAIQSSDNRSVARKTFFGRHRAAHLADASDSIYSLDYFHQRDILGQGAVNKVPDSLAIRDKSVRDLIDMTIEQLRSNMPDCDVLYVDLSREVLNIPAVRVIVTGDIQLLNYPLVLVSPRTYHFGTAMQYSQSPAAYKDLYLGRYPH